MSLKPFCYLGQCIGYVLIVRLNAPFMRLGTPPYQLTLQKIGVRIALKANSKYLSFTIGLFEFMAKASNKGSRDLSVS
jgi:hypothetical protein